MATNLIIDEVTQNVTLVVSNERGPAGPAGANGPNSVTSATTSDGTANLSLAAATVSGTLTASHIHGNIAGSVYMHVRAGEALSKGDPVYVSGSHGTGANMVPIVSRADASNAAKMPAIAIMDAAVANNGDGHAVINGTISDLDTSAYSVNGTLYVANGGGMTATKPANAQPVARVERSNANNGGIVVKVNGLYSDVTVTSSQVTDATTGGNGAADDGKLVKYLSAGGIQASSGGEIVTLGESGALGGGVEGAFWSIQLPTVTDNRFYTLPDATGTVILDSTLGAGVNGLSTITGAKSFSGQVQLTGQSATDANSAMTRWLVDTRDIGKMVYQVMPQNSGFNGVSFASVGGSNNSGAGAIISVQASSTLNNYGSLRVGSYLNMTPGPRETINFSRRFLLHGISFTAFGGTLNEGRTFWPGNSTSYTTGGMTARGFGWLQVGPNLYGQTHDGTTLRTTTAFVVRANGQNNHLAIYGDGSGNYSFYSDGTLIETLLGPTGSASQVAPSIICSAENKESGQNMFVGWQSLEFTSWT